MKDEIFDKLLSTFSKEELAGMYAIISKREVEYLKEIKILRLSLQSHGEIVNMNAKLQGELNELRGHNSTIFSAGYEAGALEQSKGSCFHCEDVALINTKLQEKNARLREALEYCLPQVERMFSCPTFYHTLSYDGDLQESEKLKRFRQALKGSEE